MEVFNAERQKNVEINNLLQKIKYKADRQEPDTFISFPLKVEDNAKFSTLYLFGKLKTLGAIKIICHSVDKINKKRKKYNYPKITSIKGWLVKPIEPKFSQLCKEYEERCNEDQTTKIIKNDDEKQKYKFPYKLPAGTQWENFIIKFENAESVYIQVKQFRHRATYKEMGFIGRGSNPKPSEAWEFFKVLAKQNGEITIKDPEARDKYKKQKELLSKRLKSYFSLDYDPFYPYRSSLEKYGNSYKTKITLMSSGDQNRKEIVDKNEDDLGLKEYLNEQAPQVYEDE